jgi:hypothetical protein
MLPLMIRDVRQETHDRPLMLSGYCPDVVPFTMTSLGIEYASKYLEGMLFQTGVGQSATLNDNNNKAHIPIGTGLNAIETTSTDISVRGESKFP